MSSRESRRPPIGEMEKPPEAARPLDGSPEDGRESLTAVDRAVEKIIPCGDPRIIERDTEFERGSEPVVIGSVEAGLEFVGTMHTNDPDSTMIREVRRLRDRYLAQVPSEQALLMIEGMNDSDRLKPENLEKTLENIKSEDEAVRAFHEGGALIWAAKMRGVEIMSPEPSEQESVDELRRQGFAAGDIGLMITMREFTSMIGRPHPESTPDTARLDFARNFFHNDRVARTGWLTAETRTAVEAANAAGNRAALPALADRIITEYSHGVNRAFARLPGMAGSKLIPSSEALLQRNVGIPEAEQVPIQAVNQSYDPNGTANVVNRISAAWNGGRDRHIVRQIAAAQARGKKPFVVYGASHAFAVEPALRELMSSGDEALDDVTGLTPPR